MKICIVDDMAEAVNEIKSRLLSELTKRRMKYLSIDTYLNPYDLVENNNSEKYDVIFMDIDMPGIRGDDAARIFRSIRPEQEIVFVSSHDEYAYDVFDIKPIAFVRKNRIDEDFPRAMDNLLKEIRRKKEIIPVRIQNEIVYIDLYSIIYLESTGHMLDIWYEKNNTAEKIVMRDSLNRYEKLLDGKGFIKIHKAFIVNHKYVAGFTEYDILLKYGLSAPISKRKRSETEKEFVELVRRLGL